jgi:hypothetical protein
MIHMNHNATPAKCVIFGYLLNWKTSLIKFHAKSFVEILNGYSKSFKLVAIVSLIVYKNKVSGLWLKLFN